MNTKVIHIKNTPKGYKTNPDYVYIGRPSIFGNPWILFNESDRQDIVEKFREWFSRAIQIETYRSEVLKLNGKILVCYCAPKACHGDVIAEYLNGLQA